MKKSFKPSILFILRDQTKRDESSINGQASKLKDRLIETSKFIDTALDDAINIETKNLTLLTNGFSEDICQILTKQIIWRNDIFPDQILKLRKYLIDYLCSCDERQNKELNSLQSLYAKLCGHWETIRQVGDNILIARI
jgi:hypothetical protein